MAAHGSKSGGVDKDNLFDAFYSEVSFRQELKSNIYN